MAGLAPISMSGLRQKAHVISNSLVVTCLWDLLGATVIGNHLLEMVSMKDLHITHLRVYWVSR